MVKTAPTTTTSISCFVNSTSELDGRNHNGTFAIGYKHNKKGVGGFQTRLQDINRGGRPKNKQSLAYWYKYFKSLTVKDFKAWKYSSQLDERTVVADLAYTIMKKANNDLKAFIEVASRTEKIPR